MCVHELATSLTHFTFNFFFSSFLKWNVKFAKTNWNISERQVWQLLFEGCVLFFLG